MSFEGLELTPGTCKPERYFKIVRIVVTWWDTTILEVKEEI